MYADYLKGVSKELLQELQHLEEIFTVDQAKLKKIVNRFIEELEEGLTDPSGSNIPMNPTWVHGFPSGKEQGTYLTIDLGGTNLRVCEITLAGNHSTEHAIKQHQYKMPDEMKKGTAKELLNYIGDSLDHFIKDHGLKPPTGKDKFSLGYTFSYPVTQERIDHGVLQRWTKGLDISGAEGQDAAAQLREEIERRVSVLTTLVKSSVQCLPALLTTIRFLYQTLFELTQSFQWTLFFSELIRRELTYYPRNYL